MVIYDRVRVKGLFANGRCRFVAVGKFISSFSLSEIEYSASTESVLYRSKMSSGRNRHNVKRCEASVFIAELTQPS